MNQDEKNKSLFRLINDYSEYYEAGYSKIEELINSGADINFIVDNYSLLYRSIKNCRKFGSADIGCEKLPLLLIEKGVNINNDTQNLLQQSIYNNHIKVPIKLYESGYILKPGELNKILQNTKSRKVDESIKSLIKMYTDKRFVNLKSRIQPVLEPKIYDTAYIMLGHGYEVIDTGLKVVPPGCMLVVEAQSGEGNYLPLKFEEEILMLGDKILDPISNYNEILTKTPYYTKRTTWEPNVVEGISFKKKSLAIYREGDEYPDYIYSLISKWNVDASDKITKNIHPPKYILRNSGIIEYPFKGKPVEYIDTTVDSNIEGKDIYLNLYNGSVYPNMDEIGAIISSMPSTTIGDILNNDGIKGKIKVKQSEIFEKIKEGIFKPGVYYNFVCRTTSNANTITKLNRTKLNRTKLNNTKPNSNSNTVIQRLNYERYNNLGVAKMPLEFKRAIAEAEVHRKPYILHAYGNAAAEMPQPAALNGLSAVPAVSAVSAVSATNNNDGLAPTISSRTRANQLQAEAVKEINRRFRVKYPGAVNRPRGYSSGGRRRYTRRRS